MALPVVPSWVSIWFLVSSILVLWDAGYCFNRPRSMVGGDLHWIWKPYSIYQRVDHVYGLPSFERGDGFTNAQSVLNVAEVTMNLVYLLKTHISPSPVAPLIALTSVFMTLNKTVLYWSQEYFCGFCATKHNTIQDLVLFYLIPNGFWLVFPTLIIFKLWPIVSASLYKTASLGTNGVAANGSRKVKGH